MIHNQFTVRLRSIGRTVTSPTYISSEKPTDVKHFHLRIVQNNDGSIAGVIQEKLPQNILVLHNFATGETWPACEVGGFELCEKTRQMLLDKLLKDHFNLQRNLKNESWQVS
jgi:hypothetical protein